MSPPRRPDDLREGDFVRDFRIERRLGEGDFALVFLVERGGERFVLKLARRPVSEQEQMRVDAWLRREVAALERLDHPALPRVVEWGRWPEPRQGHAYFVLPHIQGRTYHEWRWWQRASPHRALGVLCVLARTLEILHARGVCHRELTADNVLVDGEEVPFLIDFGSTHLPEVRSLADHLAPDTLYYQPPEVLFALFIQDHPPGTLMAAHPPGDLYALGVLLYETLTNHRPFRADGPRARLLRTIASRPPVDPRRLDPRIPDGLALLTLRLLSKDPRERPASARAVREELERLRAEAPDTGPWHAESRRPSEEEPRDDALAEEVELLREAVPPAAPDPEPWGWSWSWSWGWRLALIGCALGGVAFGGAIWAKLRPSRARPDPERYLARCSDEARATPVRLGILAEEHPAFLEDGVPPGVSARMSVVMDQRNVDVGILGVAEARPGRLYLRFDRLRLPDGREFPICGVGVDAWRQDGLATWLPRFGVVLGGPEGYYVPPLRRAAPDEP